MKLFNCFAKKALLAVALLGVVSALTVEGADTHQKGAQVAAANDAVGKLEKRISTADKSLSALHVEYDLRQPTEGVPPSFAYYFETSDTGKVVLRACKVHVGHEIAWTDYSYYFDEEGRPLKYLVENSGASGTGLSPSREGIIYDQQGRIIWTSVDLVPEIPFQAVKGLFDSLDESLKKFN